MRPVGSATPAMSRREPLGLTSEVAGDHTALTLELIEGAVIGDIPTLAVLQGDDDLLTLGVGGGPYRVGVVDAQPLVTADEVQVVVAGQGTGQQPGLAQDLESVADAQHRQAGAGLDR